VVVEPAGDRYVARVVDWQNRTIGGLADGIILDDPESRRRAAQWLARSGALSHWRAQDALDTAWLDARYRRRAAA
jgi:hypothetical protein